MVDFVKNKTWAATETIEDNANAGNVGKINISNVVIDMDTLRVAGFHKIGLSGSSNTPPDATANGIVSIFTGVQNAGVSEVSQTWYDVGSTGSIFNRIINSDGIVVRDWATEVNSSNIGSVTFGNSANPASFALNSLQFRIEPSGSNASSVRKTTGSETHVNFFNPNGAVGGISTTGTTTVYAVSSDPRLKIFKDSPNDVEISLKFDDVYSCFGLFNWKNKPDGDLVWGFNAHSCIDKNLDMGIEGLGPRSLKIGEQYKGAVIDDDGVEIDPAKFVTPAGIDQAKVVPILVAMIDQLNRRLKAGGL